MSTKNVVAINFGGNVFGDFLPYYSAKFSDIEKLFGKTIIFGETIVLLGYEEQVTQALRNIHNESKQNHVPKYVLTR